MTKTYDPKCEDLARTFLTDSPELDINKLAPLLALEIQGVIDGFLEEAKVIVGAPAVE